MFSLTITEKGGAQRKLDFDKPEITIGRVQGNDIILPKGNVSKRHSRIVLKDGRFIVVDLKSTNGTYVNGRKITSPLVVKSGDKIYIGDFIITMEDADGAGAEPDMEPPTGAPMPAAAPPSDRRPPPLRSSPPPAPSGGTGKPPPPLPSRPAPQQDRFALDEDPSDESIPPQPRVSPERGMPAAPAPRVEPRSEPAPPPYAQQAPAPYAQQAAPPYAQQAAPYAQQAPPPYAAPAPYAAPPAAPPYAQQQQQAPAPYAQPMSQPMPAAAPYVAPQAPTPAPAPPAPAPYAQPQPMSAPMAQPQPMSAPMSQPQPMSAPMAQPPVARPPLSRSAPVPGMAGALRVLMARIAQTFDVRNVDPRASGDEQRWRDAQRAIDGALASLGSGELDPSVDREALGSVALREATGRGALDALLADAGAREILVEGPTRVLVDSGRGLEPVGAFFSSADAVGIAARRFLADGGVAVGNGVTSVEARVGDWIATLLLPPLAPTGPVLVLRRADRQAATLVQLSEQGVVAADQLEKLRALVAQRRNVLVAGPLGSGVTTLLSALLGLVESRERIVTVEDVPGISTEHGNVVGLSTHGGVRLSDVLRRATMLRPDRLVIDDLRGSEVYDALVSMAARRSATLAGVHASSFEDALRHVEVLACLGGQVQPTTARSLLREAVHAVVVLGVDGGQRRVVSISDV